MFTAAGVVEIFNITPVAVVDAASLLITKDQVSEPHHAGSVIAKSVKWFVVNHTYGCPQILTTLVVI